MSTMQINTPSSATRRLRPNDDDDLKEGEQWAHIGLVKVKSALDSREEWDALDAKLAVQWTGYQAFRNTDPGANILAGMTCVLEAMNVGWHEFLSDYLKKENDQLTGSSGAASGSA